jgi:hypothetical protein
MSFESQTNPTLKAINPNLFLSTSPSVWCAGLAYVCEGLKEQRKGLVTLVLWNNQLTHNGMGYLAAALVNTHATK